VLKKIRRMVAVQALTLSAAMWFGWKNREAIERAVRAARAAWHDTSTGRAGDEEVVVAAVVLGEPTGSDGPGATPSAFASAPNEPAAMRPGY
jgi:hypothetical protein